MGMNIHLPSLAPVRMTYDTHTQLSAACTAVCQKTGEIVVDRCSALQGRMQCTAGAVALHCRSGCTALQGRLQCTASEMGKRDTEIVSPVLDKRKGKKTVAFLTAKFTSKNVM